ncbi:LysM peptidoglycan-binding domain-containing protein [Arthrobacter castelli]|uniref:LysM peptidoglycan-binding domain-containing protein n=1 Tax=Arthrobacter castelli TaxID=271431 RepID=UPI0006879BEC|nr:LysM peptidoglycan-binding domain-containing protein [Arthrobacter castelli]
MTAQAIDQSAFPYVPKGPQPATREVLPNHSTRLHLTRRGRLLLIGIPLMAAAACLVFSLGFFNSPATAASEAPPEPAGSVTYTVAPGDTVWTIAAVVAGGGDTRDAVQAIMDLNQLETSTIQVGQQLFLPAGD